MVWRILYSGLTEVHKYNIQRCPLFSGLLEELQWRLGPLLTVLASSRTVILGQLWGPATASGDSGKDLTASCKKCNAPVVVWFGYWSLLVDGHNGTVNPLLRNITLQCIVTYQVIHQSITQFPDLIGNPVLSRYLVVLKVPYCCCEIPSAMTGISGFCCISTGTESSTCLSWFRTISKWARRASAVSLAVLVLLFVPGKGCATNLLLAGPMISYRSWWTMRVSTSSAACCRWSALLSYHLSFTIASSLLAFSSASLVFPATFLSAMILSTATLQT